MPDIFEKEISEYSGSKLNINEKWLSYQRNKLIGAIDQIESSNAIDFPFKWIFFKFQEAPLSFALVCIFSLIAGFSAGFFFNASYSGGNDRAGLNIMDMLSSDKISTVQLDIDKNLAEPYIFKFLSNDDYQYAGRENDQNVILLLDHMLNNTANPGDRLKLARKLSDTGVTNDMALSVIIKALLLEDNTAIQSVLIESLQHNETTTARDALLQIVIGHYDAPVRLSALKYLTQFSSDPHVTQILKVVSISDENPSVRYTAEKLLMASIKSVQTGGEIKK